MKTIELTEEQIAYLIDLKSNKKKRKFLLDSIIWNLSMGKLFSKPIGERIVFKNGEFKTEKYNDDSKLVMFRSVSLKFRACFKYIFYKITTIFTFITPFCFGKSSTYITFFILKFIHFR